MLFDRYKECYKVKSAHIKKRNKNYAPDREFVGRSTKSYLLFQLLLYRGQNRALGCYQEGIGIGNGIRIAIRIQIGIGSGDSTIGVGL